MIAAALMLPALSCRKAEPEGGAVDTNALLGIELSPAANVEWRTYCSRCGHTYTYYDASHVIGLDRDELASRYPDWEIVTFTREYALITRSIDRLCPEHHVLYLKDGGLEVYSVTEPELEEELLIGLDATPFGFDPNAEEMLSRGAVFDSLRDLDEYLGSFAR
ncbi:MAG: hypothetical protein J5772_02535 [Clostridia bacterium]|nr:hypothetical protein [Clostridia bacterium]